MLKNLVIGAVLGLVLAGSACSTKGGDETPVATPSVTFGRTRVALGSPVEVGYKFVVARGAPRIRQDYRVFVHFLDANDELMWTDDHELPVPTTRWTPGQTIEYARTVFVPIYPYVGEATIRVGLHSPKDRQRLPLSGDDNGQRAYRVATINLLPQSENLFLIYKDGWHGTEVSAENAAVEWQWTKGKSTISFRNPRRDAMLYLHLDGRADLFERPQEVTVSIGNQVLDRFPVATRDEIIRKVPVTAARFGDADMIDVEISVDQTFVPAQVPAAASTDARELGVRVFHAFVEPR